MWNYIYTAGWWEQLCAMSMRTELVGEACMCLWHMPRWDAAVVPCMCSSSTVLQGPARPTLKLPAEKRQPHSKTSLTLQSKVLSTDLPPLLASVLCWEMKAEARSGIQTEILNNFGWKGPLWVPGLSPCSKPVQGEVEQKWEAWGSGLEVCNQREGIGAPWPFSSLQTAWISWKVP